MDMCPESRSIQHSGDTPTFAWVRSRVLAGAGLGLTLREGWVDTFPESWIDRENLGSWRACRESS